MVEPREPPIVRVTLGYFKLLFYSRRFRSLPRKPPTQPPTPPPSHLLKKANKEEATPVTEKQVTNEQVTEKQVMKEAPIAKKQDWVAL